MPKIKVKYRPLYIIQMQWISCTLFGVVWDLEESALCVLVPFLDITLRFKNAQD